MSFSGGETKRTHDKLTDFVPFHVAAWFMHYSDSDSPLEALYTSGTERVVTFFKLK